jgi:hypothetical protein
MCNEQQIYIMLMIDAQMIWYGRLGRECVKWRNAMKQVISGDATGNKQNAQMIEAK